MIKERFIELLTKDLAGEISDQERQELSYLMGEDESYRKEAELYRMYWGRSYEKKIDSQAVFSKVLGKIKERESLEEPSVSFFEEPEVFEESKVKGPFLNRWFTAGLKIAATVSIAVLSMLTYNYVNDENTSKRGENWLVKVTPRGVKSSFILPDGTRIILNAGSKLEYPKEFDGKTREVYFTGEGFFDVREDKKHPFIIHADEMNIKVLGTAFNVKSYKGDKTSEATLIRGSIAVSMNDHPDERVVLKPSQKLVIMNSRDISSAENKLSQKGETNKISKLTTITYFKDSDTTAIETSWVENKLIFKQEDFESVARKMERWYNVDVKFQKENVKGLKFTGAYEQETLDEALKTLQMTEGFSFKYKIEKSTVTIY
ncbi:FecR family protein [Desertivirga arenae]|uniref:FecR family protein n=1 Tax=Desertivirga arenae TaxID=2810309 RepID=UPI001A978C4A|nr:FecR family protein [Pedobacter sp. SYSU D00823]